MKLTKFNLISVLLALVFYSNSFSIFAEAATPSSADTTTVAGSPASSSAELPTYDFDAGLVGDLGEQGWFLETRHETNSSQTGTPPSILVARPLKPGRLTLPSLVLKNKDGKSIAKTNPFSFDVGSAIKKDDPKPDQPNDIEPPLSLKFPLLMILGFILAGIAGLIAIGYGSYRAYKKYWPQKKAEIENAIPEDELALSQLSDLEKQDLLKEGLFKAYYFRLSEILKQYIGSRYRFDAPESTSAELIQFLKEGKELSNLYTIELQELLDKLDLVKFTDYIPQSSEPQSLIAEARTFVKNTRRLPILSTTTSTVRTERGTVNAS